MKKLNLNVNTPSFKIKKSGISRRQLRRLQNRNAAIVDVAATVTVVTLFAVTAAAGVATIKVALCGSAEERAFRKLSKRLAGRPQGEVQVALLQEKFLPEIKKEGEVTWTRHPAEIITLEIAQEYLSPEAVAVFQQRLEDAKLKEGKKFHLPKIGKKKAVAEDCEDDFCEEDFCEEEPPKKKKASKKKKVQKKEAPAPVEAEVEDEVVEETPVEEETDETPVAEDEAVEEAHEEVVPDPGDDDGKPKKPNNKKQKK